MLRVVHNAADVVGTQAGTELCDDLRGIGLRLRRVCQQRPECSIDQSRYLLTGAERPRIDGSVHSEECDTCDSKRDAHSISPFKPVAQAGSPAGSGIGNSQFCGPPPRFANRSQSVAPAAAACQWSLQRGPNSETRSEASSPHSRRGPVSPPKCGHNRAAGSPRQHPVDLACLGNLRIKCALDLPDTLAEPHSAIGESPP